LKTAFDPICSRLLAAAERSYSSLREDAINSRIYGALDPETCLTAGARRWRG
jgi:hypothetical protein